jgi:sarcosine oxidase delta subunit
MASKSEYWQHAEACTRWASEAKSARDREILLEISKIWTQMALRERADEAIMQAYGEHESRPPNFQ